MIKKSRHPVSLKAGTALVAAVAMALVAGVSASPARADGGWHGGRHEGWHGDRGRHRGWDHDRGDWRGYGRGGYYPGYVYNYPRGYGYGYAAPYAYVAPVPVYPPAYGYFGW
jgi:hypothetical protein